MSDVCLRQSGVSFAEGSNIHRPWIFQYPLLAEQACKIETIHPTIYQ